MSRVSDPRRAMDVQPDVPVSDRGRLARVKPHPDSHVRPIRPVVSCQGSLDLDDRTDRGDRGPEDREERVALGPDLRAALAIEDAANDPRVIPQDLGVRVTELAQEPR
jgi:hypothetical protein